MHFALCTYLTGCVRRVFTVTSEPSGALVEMNSQEIGRTPFQKDFTWYGDYDVLVRAEGYETLHTDVGVPAPWWQWIPIDFVTEFFPITDEHKLHFALKPSGLLDTHALLDRAQAMKPMLESTEHTTTKPKSTTRPTSNPSTKRTKSNG